MTIRLAWSCAIAALVACKTAAPVPVRIQLFGDSTQWGYDPSTERPVAQPPVALLQAAMDARFGVGRVLVTERAAPGTTSSDLVAGKDDRNRPWPREVNADIVVMNHALNDSHEHIDVATYRANLVTLHATVYETPNPVTVDWPEAPYAAAMREVATSLHAPIADVETWMRAQPSWQTLLTPDGIHPTSEGYRRIVHEVLMPTLEPLVAAILQGQR